MVTTRTMSVRRRELKLPRIAEESEEGVKARLKHVLASCKKVKLVALLIAAVVATYVAGRAEAQFELAATHEESLARAETENSHLRAALERAKAEVFESSGALEEAKAQVSELQASTTRSWLAALPEPPRGAPSGRTSIVECGTTTGPLTLAVFEAWAPHGARRFLDLVRSGFFESHVAVHRVFPNWLAFFGIAGNPQLNKEWAPIEDDPQWISGKTHFERGYVSFASTTGEPHSRTTVLFVMLGSDTNHLLGGQHHEVPFARVIGEQSFRTLDAWRDNFHQDDGVPDADRALRLGLSYLHDAFPRLDYITHCAAAELQA